MIDDFSKKMLKNIKINVEMFHSPVFKENYMQISLSVVKTLLMQFLVQHENCPNSLKNSGIVKFANIKIFADQSKNQKIEKELNTCLARGENKMIKYINNIPTIINQTQTN